MPGKIDRTMLVRCGQLRPDFFHACAHLILREMTSVITRRNRDLTFTRQPTQLFLKPAEPKEFHSSFLELVMKRVPVALLEGDLPLSEQN